MSFAQRYNTELQHVSSRKLTLHLVGRVLVAIAVGVFFARPLEQYAGLMLIGGILIMLPVLAHVLQERGLKRNKRRAAMRKR
ncbi:MAG: hypothetical protein AABY13_02310 [Nanoarchaeota archaeon]